jgi:hypothetical protein
MPDLSSNVDELLNNVHTNYKNGILRSNRFIINMDSPTGEWKHNVPAFAVRIPGWDVGTVVETGVLSSIRYMPFRKNWNQGLFVSFYMQKNNDGSVYDFINKWCNSMVLPDGPNLYYNNLIGSSLEVIVGDDPDTNISWKFEECYPRVIYPIELKPVEDFAPFIFSVQFSYRYFDNFVGPDIIG